MKFFSADLAEGIAADITDQLNAVASEFPDAKTTILMSGSPTTGLFIADKHLAGGDLAVEMRRTLPARHSFLNQKTSPLHLAADLRAAITGKVLTLMCKDGKIFLPCHQRVFAINYETSASVEFSVVVR